MECDTFNGNVVLVPAPIVAKLGHVDGTHFPHAMGDIDYGLRVRSAGFVAFQAKGTLGMCERNPPTPSIGGPISRLRAVSGPKRLPPRAWWVFCMRYGGWLALPYFAKPYLWSLKGGRSG
jgi:hypothetical protein